MKKTSILLLTVLLVSSLAGCGPKETVIDGEEKDAVLAFSESKTDNLLAGMNAHDYAACSKDFEQPMLNAMPAEAFDKFKQDYDGRLRAYVSRQVNKVTQSQSGKYVAVIYDTVFEKNDAVIMRVVIRADDPQQIGGLWFNK